MKLWIKALIISITGIALTIANIFWTQSAFAASEPFVGIMFSADEDDNIISAFAGIAFREANNATVICTSNSIINDSSAYYAYQGEDEYIADYSGNIPEANLALFTAEEGGSDGSVFDYDYPVNGQSVEFQFLCSDRSFLSVPANITGYYDESGYYFLKYSIKDSDNKKVSESSAVVPGAVINDEGNLIGIICSDGKLISMIFDIDIFSEGSAVNSEPDQPDESDKPNSSNTEPKGRDYSDEASLDETKTASETETMTVSYPPDTSDTPVPPAPNPPNISLIIIIASAAAVLAAVVTVIVLIVNKKKNTPALSSPPPPVTPITPVQIPEHPVEPTEPIAVPTVPQPVSSALYLYCQGGVMDGRRYPITKEGLLIGRDPAAHICYPADTKGVSRRHCQVFWKNGVLMIMDLGSTSGTFIRGKGQIPPNVPMAVNAGDTFYLGEKLNGFKIQME